MVSGIAGHGLFICLLYLQKNQSSHPRKKRIPPFFYKWCIYGSTLDNLFLCFKTFQRCARYLVAVYFPHANGIVRTLVSKRKFNPIHLVLGLLILGGLSFLVPDFNLKNSQVKGILFGVFSALCYAIRILILKNMLPIITEPCSCFIKRLLLQFYSYQRCFSWILADCKVSFLF